MNDILIICRSIARYTVTSLLIPFEPTKGSSERTLRVQGSSSTFQALVNALSTARGVEYETQYLDPEEAKEKEELARLAGNEEEDMGWSIRPLIASGFRVADGHGEVKGLDNDRFDFTPETLEETFKRVYG